jgi:hypothetical protein
MPVSQKQAAKALSSAAKNLGAKGQKPGRTRVAIPVTELTSSGPQIAANLADADQSARDAVQATELATSKAVSDAQVALRASQASIKSADGKQAKAAAERDQKKSQAALDVAKVADAAAQKHLKASSPADKAEDEAATYQAKAEAARSAADIVRLDGDTAVTAALESASSAVVTAEAEYDQAMTRIEKEVRSALGI